MDSVVELECFHCNRSSAELSEKQVFVWREFRPSHPWDIQQNICFDCLFSLAQVGLAVESVVYDKS